MKKITIGKAEYVGEDGSGGFIVSFQVQILRTLEKRGLLTGNQCERGILMLKERSL